MKILSEVPQPLKGRGHNECVPMECEKCADLFLFGLSDGIISDGDLEEDTVPVRCPRCGEIEEVPSIALSVCAKNGQVV